MIETQQQNISDSLVNRIKGLLRLATSNNQHEAELAMARAKQLCVKYELDIASIQAFDEKPVNEPIVKGESVNLGRRMSICQHYISNILQDYFNVRVIYFGGRHGGKRIVFVGRQRDIDLATYLNNYLNQEFLRLWRKYYSDNEINGVSLKDRGGFLYGLKQGLADKLRESQKITEEEVFTAAPVEKLEKIKECYALAVVNHKKNLEDKLGEFYPHLRKNSHYHSIKNYNSIGAGREAGRNISVNRPLGNSNLNRLNG